jgi:uncharacterized protein (TIGR02246 family)
MQMFECYTEQARRVIFFARFEASNYGSRTIETEHLLLGLLNSRVGPPPSALRQVGTPESIRSDVEARIIRGEPFSGSVEVPLSMESKNVLNYAADSAEQLQHPRVEAVHLLLGILREEQCLAAKILRERGVQGSDVEKDAARLGNENPGRPGVATAVHAQKAILRMLEAWSARDARKVAGFFAWDGLVTDLQGDLWTGPDGAEQALAKFFSKWRNTAASGELTDLRSIRTEAWLATVTWKSSKKTKGRASPTLRLIAVFTHNRGDWRIVWAHLLNIRPT